jgi:hypothetical protein
MDAREELEAVVAEVKAALDAVGVTQTEWAQRCRLYPSQVTIYLQGKIGVGSLRGRELWAELVTILRSEEGPGYAGLAGRLLAALAAVQASETEGDDDEEAEHESAGDVGAAGAGDGDPPGPS